MQSTSWEMLDWKKHKLESRLPNPTSARFTPLFSFKKFTFRFCIFIFGSFWVNCDSLWRGSNSFFAYGYSAVMGPFTAKTVLSLLNGFRESRPENQWTLSFSPRVLIYPVPASHCPHYCGFVAGFEVGKCESPNFVLLFQDCFGCSGSLTISCEF